MCHVGVWAQTVGFKLASSPISSPMLIASCLHSERLLPRYHALAMVTLGYYIHMLPPPYSGLAAPMVQHFIGFSSTPSHLRRGGNWLRSFDPYIDFHTEHPSAPSVGLSAIEHCYCKRVVQACEVSRVQYYQNGILTVQ